jgi:tetratricopeptide (TPR) repeat protein
VQLTRLLDVRRDRIRFWIRAGLIQPVETVHRLAYFDFQQVAGLKKLSELIQAGVTTRRLRQSLSQLKRWIPDLETPLHQLRLLEQDRQLVVCLPSGQRAEPSGQLLLDFSEPVDAPTALLPSQSPAAPAEAATADELFERGVALEDAGLFDEAAATYRQLMAQTGPAPESCFNLGNVLHYSGHREEAAAQYRLALELDVDYVEAWNNLGTVLAETGQTKEAMNCFHQALVLAPDYADAHYNAAQTLTEAGRDQEAAVHRMMYLKLAGRLNSPEL